MAKLHMYQLEAIKDILDKERVIIADDMGLGKTAEAIAAKTVMERRLGYRVPTLICCPEGVIDHWQNEARKWYHKGFQTKFALVNADNYERGMRNASEADFVITTHSTLSHLGQQRTNQLLGLNFLYGIIDEAHNAKNPSSIRSRATRELFGPTKYLSILTGTPMPNGVIDLYVLLNLIDSKAFPIHSENPNSILGEFYRIFTKDPNFVRSILHDEPNGRMIRRTVESLGLGATFPELREDVKRIQLTGEHREAYTALYENDSTKALPKIWQLIRGSIDPNLINPAYLPPHLARRVGEMKSDVYESLDNLVEKSMDERGKVLIFTDVKDGVTANLAKRYSKYGAIIIQGSGTNYKRKEEKRRLFQRDPNVRVLITTTVMNEGVDLTAATDAVDLTLPYTPKDFDQRIRRTQRINAEIQKASVNRHIMFPYIDEFTPVITEGIMKMINDKRMIIEYILQARTDLTVDDFREAANGKKGLAKSRNLVAFTRAPSRMIARHFGSLRGKGHNVISKRFQTHKAEAEYLAKLYASHWEGFYGGNVANLYGEAIKLLDERENLDRKVDIASGPFSLSRKIGMPVTNLDLNKFMLEAGRNLEKRGVIASGNVAVEGSFHDLPFEKSSFDLANLSLALHYSRLNRNPESSEVSERELVLREMNRVLRKGGYGVITLPYSVISTPNVPVFNEGLQKLGFEVLPFSGFYRSPQQHSFRVHLTGLRKVTEAPEDSVGQKYFEWKMDAKKKVKKGPPKDDPKKKAPLPQTEKDPIHLNNFVHSESGKSLSEIIGE